MLNVSCNKTLVMSKKNLILLLTVLICISTFAKRTEIDSLMRFSRHPKHSYSQKIELCKELIIKYKNDSLNLGKAYANLGAAYVNHNQYKDAAINYEKAIRIATKYDDNQQLTLTYFLLGNVHLETKNFDRAIELFRNAENLARKNSNSKLLAMIYNSQGIIFAQRPDLGYSFTAFDNAYQILDSMGLEFEKTIPMGNIGDYYLRIKEPNLALKVFLANLNVLEVGPYYADIAICKGNIGLSYQQKGQYEKAISYFNQSLTLAKNHQLYKITYDNYNDLSETYRLKKNFKKALFFKEKYIMLKDSILNSETTSEIAKLNLVYENEKKEKQLVLHEHEILQLETLEKTNRYKMLLAIGGFVLLLVVTTMIFFKLRSNITKHRLEEQINQNKLEQQKKESSRLETELTNKTQDLTSFALDISRKNEFTISIDDKLKKIRKTADAADKERLLQELILKTNNHLKINSDYQLFQSNIEKVNHQFLKKLHTNYQGLTTNETHLCGLIRLGLTTKEVASIKNISPDSVEVSRYRLRKKLALPEGTDLNLFLTTM
ncbi:MAG: tetratricopeptide (TPR) repeat protein [Parvicella sp.]|jgi:tetratricopeptide (TPR) repeat protein